MADGPKLLSGGNPQIPKGDGDEPVQAYLDAAPDWKGRVVRRIDEIVVRSVPDVRKAVRWNSPFYGTPGSGYFLSYHCLTNYVKLTFFDGDALDPEPPERGKDAKARFLHVREDDEIDEAQLTSWVRQASALPGWDLT